jgi:hypothetical protein
MPKGHPVLTREERIKLVEHVEQMMREGQWVTGVSGKQIAEKLKLPIPTMWSIAAEASRRASSESPEEKQLRRAETLSDLTRLAIKAENAGDLRVAVDAKRSYADVAGLKVTEHRHVVAHLPPIMQQARLDAITTGDERAVALLRAHGELEVESVDDAQLTRAERLVEDWKYTTDAMREKVLDALGALVVGEGTQ